MRSRLALLLSVVLVLALGLVANTVTDRTRPSGSVATRFSLGEDVLLGEYQVHVHGARAAEALDGDGTWIETRGVWVIVDLSYATVREPGLAIELGLRDSSGRTYTVSDRGPITGWAVAPDTWFRGEVAFEVPIDALGRLTLFVWPDARFLSEQTPVGYGVTSVTVSPDDVATDPEALAEPTLLPAGER